MELRSFLVALLLPLVAVSKGPPAFRFPSDPPYGASTRELASILHCPYGINATSKPVLLVHGTGSTGKDTFTPGYLPALRATEFTPCYVNLKFHSLNDVQVSAAYVAYTLHYLSYKAKGAKVAAISHSQGSIDVQWALHFFPSSRKVTRAFIPLSPELSGIDKPSNPNCNLPPFCAPAVWQMLAGSNFYKALNFKGHKAQVPTTMIWSTTDNIVAPSNKNAALKGASSISVQQLCPGRKTGHISMLVDAAGYALAIDALRHNGRASLSRVKKAVQKQGTCGKRAGPHMNPAGLKAAVRKDGINFAKAKRVLREPAIKKYAQLKNQ